MKTLMQDLLTSFVMGILLPFLLLNGAVRLDRLQPEPEASEETQVSAAEFQIPVLQESGGVQLMDESQYLAGVVLAEMPASFHTEALKAQAVAARTYTRKAVASDKHGGCLCTDSRCCQAYLDSERYLEQGGTEDGIRKTAEAVTETAGMVLTYGGELIEATYFSSAGGSTEAAVAVWGTDYPYLQAVDSPEEEQFHSTIFTPGQFQDALGMTLEGSPETWVGLTTYTDGGGVDTMVIGGETFTGVQLRQKLNLRSTDFSLDIRDGQICITASGHGHRVGMSQYGADAMADGGSSYREILHHYYPGVDILVLEK